MKCLATFAGLAALGLLMFVVSTGGAGAQVPGGKGGPESKVQSGVERTVIPASAQREQVEASLEAYRKNRDVLRGRAPQRGNDIAALEAEIAKLETRVAAGFNDQEIDARYVHLGNASAYWIVVTYSCDYYQCVEKDPVNLFFYGEAYRNSLLGRMTSWTRNTPQHRWEADTEPWYYPCEQAAQLVGMKNESYDPWTWRVSNDAYGNALQPSEDDCGLDSRHHVRTFHLQVSDPEWGIWGIGAAHYENWVGWGIWHSVVSWAGGRERVQQSFRQWENGPAFPWVGAMWTFSCNNNTYYGGVLNDGICYAIEVH